MQEATIGRSARKRYATLGITDDDVLYAFYTSHGPLVGGDGMRMYVGFTPAGLCIEIGVDTVRHPYPPHIVHVMQASKHIRNQLRR